LFICFVEFFASVSFSKEEKRKKVLKFVCEESLKKEFVCAVCLFFEFFVSKNVHSDCEFCDSTLILFLLFVFESIVSFAVLSILENLASEDSSSSASFSSIEREESKAEKKVVFTSCSFACFFLASFVESLLVFVFLFLNQLSDCLLF
jgi:hypothetical protein